MLQALSHQSCGACGSGVKSNQGRHSGRLHHFQSRCSGVNRTPSDDERERLAGVPIDYGRQHTIKSHPEGSSDGMATRGAITVLIISV